MTKILKLFKRYFSNKPVEPDIICVNCGSKNTTATEKMRRTGGKLYKGRLMSYGYFLNVHFCNDCGNKWDGERTRNS